jgi:small-conductance mechanosensitive channel
MAEHEIIYEAERAKAEQLAVVAPLIKLFTVVATLGLFLFFWLKAEIHVWVSGALAFTIAIISNRIIALFAGMFLGRRYARQLKARMREHRGTLSE